MILKFLPTTHLSVYIETHTLSMAEVLLTKEQILYCELTSPMYIDIDPVKKEELQQQQVLNAWKELLLHPTGVSDEYEYFILNFRVPGDEQVNYLKMRPSLSTILRSLTIQEDELSQLQRGEHIWIPFTISDVIISSSKSPEVVTFNLYPHGVIKQGLVNVPVSVRQ